MTTEPVPNEPTPKPRDLKWSTLFGRSRSAIFVLNSRRQLRYANAAWERATGASLAKLRGTQFSETRTSASPLWATLAPPREVWRGEAARVRRPAPGTEFGPPWWDIAYMPLRGNGDLILGVVAVLEIVGTAPPRGAAKLPTIFEQLRHRRLGEFTFDLLDGALPALQRLQAQLRWAAEQRVPTWLIGERGTGLETLAKVMHGAGRQRETRFVALECTGLQPYLLEGLLFGKGGLATGRSTGTLFLKNPASLPRDLQTRVAEWCTSASGPHLISGSLNPVAHDVAAGRLIPKFQSDLATLEVRIPPLRERLDELPRFLVRITPDRAAPSEAVLKVLRSYSWPGNFHELASVWHDAGHRAAGVTMAPEHLPRFLRERFLIESSPGHTRPQTSLDTILESVERRMILRALAQCDGRQSDAAAKLGLVRARLARRMDALKIVWPPETES
jgi:transcriptional regulator with PAS, ATPase and Fis domain